MWLNITLYYFWKTFKNANLHNTISLRVPHFHVITKLVGGSFIPNVSHIQKRIHISTVWIDNIGIAHFLQEKLEEEFTF